MATQPEATPLDAAAAEPSPAAAAASHPSGATVMEHVKSSARNALRLIGAISVDVSANDRRRLRTVNTHVHNMLDEMEKLASVIKHEAGTSVKQEEPDDPPSGAAAAAAVDAEVLAQLG